MSRHEYATSGAIEQGLLGSTRHSNQDELIERMADQRARMPVFKALRVIGWVAGQELKQVGDSTGRNAQPMC
jgi:hypothetical protein